MSDIGNSVGGIISPILGLAVAGFAVKTIGDMYHASCQHCGHTIKSKKQHELKARAERHSRSHPQRNMWF